MANISNLSRCAVPVRQSALFMDSEEGLNEAYEQVPFMVYGPGGRKFERQAERGMEIKRSSR